MLEGNYTIAMLTQIRCDGRQGLYRPANTMVNPKYSIIFNAAFQLYKITLIANKLQKICGKNIQRYEIYHTAINHTCDPYGSNQILTGGHGTQDEGRFPPFKALSRVTEALMRFHGNACPRFIMRPRCIT